MTAKCLFLYGVPTRLFNRCCRYERPLSYSVMPCAAGLSLIIQSHLTLPGDHLAFDQAHEQIEEVGNCGNHDNPHDDHRRL